MCTRRLLFCFAAAAVLAAGACSKTYNVVVPADAGWVDTGIEIRQGDRIEFSAEGTVNYGMPMSGGPDGYDHPSPMAISSHGLCGALVGRVDDGSPFLIGSHRKVEAGRGGTLYLAVNDEPGQFDNNTGSFRVRMQIHR